MVFVIHWHESAMDLHVFPIRVPPTTSFSTQSLWVFPVHQAQALVSCIQPGLVICFTLDNIHVLKAFLIKPLGVRRYMIPLTMLCIILCEVAIEGKETAVSLSWAGSTDINYNDFCPPKFGDWAIQVTLSIHIWDKGSSSPCRRNFAIW